MRIEELVLCVLREELPEEWLRDEIALPLSAETFRSVVDALSVSYLRRGDVEGDIRYKQIIPYVLVCNHTGEILTYVRHGTEQRLHGLHSIGIGGHINSGDQQKTPYDSILTGAKREAREELGIKGEFDLVFLGVINEERTAVGNTHLGAVFRLAAEPSCLIPDEELADWRFSSPEQIASLRMELWSRLAYSLLNGEKVCYSLFVGEKEVR